MAPRAYRSPLRDDAMHETVRRIVRAAVDLHAERGLLGTSHADIAARAGVSVPTVYKHFPTRASLLPACMGHVGQAAPPLDATAVVAMPHVEERIDALVDAVCARHAYFAPWQRWSYHEAPRVPELAAALGDNDASLHRLVAAALAPAFRGRPPKPVSALARTLLHFTTWQRLRHELPDDKAVRRTLSLTLRLVVANALNERKP